MKYFLTLCWLLFAVSLSAQKMSKPAKRLILIPLDDRPPCLQFTQKMGLIANAEVVAPPIEILGKFMVPGQSDKIISWLEKQDLKSFDGAIISFDMVAYGGLVASRIHHVSYEEAIKRMQVMRRLRKLAPKLVIYGQSVIMRLAPTGDGKNEAYRENLGTWAEIAVSKDEKLIDKTKALEKLIPAEALLDYKQARKRNLAINLEAIDLVKEGVIDYLILSQDDAKPEGIHVADRERLISRVKALKLSDKILVQPGADEISMLLLSRALNKSFNFSPKIKAVYSSEALSNTTMPFEDRPLKRTVSFNIQALGAREVSDEAQADLLFYVFASRFEAGRAVSFAQEIENKIKQGKRVMVADVDPRGDVQGGDTQFTMELLNRKLFPRVQSYASWNTAGNTIGTALPQGVVFSLAQAKLLPTTAVNVKNNILQAQNWFTFHRVIDDYYYHTLVRSQAKKFIRDQNWNAMDLGFEHSGKVEAYASALLLTHFNELSQHFKNNQVLKNEFSPSNLNFVLPWRRTFEADIDFDVKPMRSVKN
jgi:hypothetical protein